MVALGIHYIYTHIYVYVYVYNLSQFTGGIIFIGLSEVYKPYFFLHPFTPHICNQILPLHIFRTTSGSIIIFASTIKYNLENSRGKYVFTHMFAYHVLFDIAKSLPLLFPFCLENFLLPFF